MKDKMKSKIFKSILFILTCLVIAFIIGFISAKYLKESVDTNIIEDNIFVAVFRMFGAFLIMVVGFLVHIIIHEAGHLIFGLMTGYSFVSFRIGSHTIVNVDNKLKYKRFNIPGTAGQWYYMQYAGDQR